MSTDQQDDGFSLVETVVAMAIFAVLAAVTAGLLLNTFGLTRSSGQRTAAANVAARYVEEVRGMRALDIPNGESTLPPVTVGSTTYSVQRTATYVTAGGTATLCSGTGSTIAYKLVTVVVTWPGMGRTRPVRSDTLKVLGLGVDGLNASRGTIALQVSTGTGVPVPGATVTLATAGTVRTGIDGCAVFPGLAPGSYTGTVSKTGHTGLRGVLTPTTPSLPVTAGTVTRTTVRYDVPGALRLSYSVPVAGHVPPAALGVTVEDSTPLEALPDCTAVAAGAHCTSGTWSTPPPAVNPRTADRMFPSTYAVWGGACAPKPTSPTSVAVAAGKLVDVTVPLAPLVVTFKNSSGALVTGPASPPRTLYLASVATPCPYVLQVPATASTLNLALPTGTWRASLTADGSAAPAGGWPQVALNASSPMVSPVPTVDVVVP